MKTIVAVMLSVACLSACHTVHTELGPDRYLLHWKRGHGFMGIANKEIELVARAEKFCSAQGKRADIERILKSRPPYLLGNYPYVDIYYTCIDYRSPAPAEIEHEADNAD